MRCLAARCRRAIQRVTGALRSRYQAAAMPGSGLAEEAAEQRRGPGHVLFHRAPGPVGIAGVELDDALTGARNRRRFEVDLAEQIDRARRYGEQAVLLIIDIDRFKQINDSRGHRAGDRALKDVADALRRRLRSTDLLARLGGDEFGVLLPHAGPPQAEAVAADLRRVVSDLNFDLPGAQHLTVSIGYTVVDQSSGDDVEVFAAADQAMYRDKFGNR